jgi:hypothetical protein
MACPGYRFAYPGYALRFDILSEEITAPKKMDLYQRHRPLCVLARL